jgi:hypothetical protein
MQSNHEQLKPNINGIPDGILKNGGNEKALINQGFIQRMWRRDRDSNPDFQSFFRYISMR